jgi:vacuolar-type H+-ATPase subunit H
VLEALDKIKRAEAERNKALEDAKRAKPSRCREAELEVEKKLAEAETRIEKEIDVMLAKGQEEIEKEIRALSSQYEKDREWLEKQVLKNKKQAVEFVKQRIL